MKKDTALIVAGIIFTIVALAHLLRLVFNTEIIISGSILPMNISLVALIISALLAIWMFLAARSNR